MNGWRGAVAQLFGRLAGLTARQAGRLDDLQIVDSGLAFADGALDYLWSEVVEHDGARTWRGFRVVQLSELTYLPQEVRAEASLIRRQAALQRGLWAAGVELITLSFGMFEPPVGVVQCYGAGARGATRAEAVEQAAAAHAAVLANFAAQFPQSRLKPLALDRTTWLAQALHDMEHVTALIGHPDPREGARGGSQERTRPADAFTEQQNELLFRAMARARQEFVCLNIATPVARADIARMQAALGNLTSTVASRQQGSTSIGFGVSLPVILSVAQGLAAGESYGTSHTDGQSSATGSAHGTTDTEGLARTSSWAHTVGQAHTEGTAETDSVAHTSGTSHSVSVSEGSAQTQGTAHTAGAAHTESSSFGTATTEASGMSQTHGVVTSQSETAGVSHGTSESTQLGLALPLSVNAGIKGGIPAETLTLSGGGSAGITPSIGHSAGTSESVSQATSTGLSVSDVTTASHMSSVSHSESHGSADTVSQADTTSQAATQSQGRSESWSTMEATTVGHAATRSQADTVSESFSVGGATTRSQAHSVSESQSQSQGTSRADGVSLGRTLGATQAMGLGAGVSPGISVGKSFQWKDENAVVITELLEEQLNLLKEAVEEGGLYSDLYLLTRSEAGRRTAEAAAVQAFGGSQGVVTHLQVRRPAGPAEAGHLRLHAAAFTPSSLAETLGWLNGYAYSTLITPVQQAAYSAPGLFEEGTALTVQERTPPFAFRPDLRGEAVLGHLFSTERGEQTSAPLALSEERHFHTVYAGDTGAGKTVAAERTAVEVVSQWHHRAVVLDFGAGWRRLLDCGLPAERVEVYQLYPGAPRPLRWNIMQLGRRLTPEQQYLATAELLCAAGRMGPRQIAFLRRMMREAYIAAGVLLESLAEGGGDTYDKYDRRWQRLQPGEPEVVEQARLAWGLPAGPARTLNEAVSDLTRAERQAVLIHRSKRVDINQVYDRANSAFSRLGDRDPSRAALEGAVLRLEPFTRGELARMYGRGEGSLAIEDLGLLGPEPELDDRWGLCVLEGGAELDEYSKVVILSLAAWHLYTDAQKRRRESIGSPERNRPLDIFWEEANKLLTGVGDGDSAATSSAAGAVSLWQAMWRDGRKYKVFLHPIVQTLAELPAGILASCNNAFFGQMKSPADRDLAVSHLARSERGFTDEEYKRYLSRLPRELAIVKLGYSADVTDLEPLLARPLMVLAREPSDDEIERRWRRARV